MCTDSATANANFALCVLFFTFVPKPTAKYSPASAIMNDFVLTAPAWSLKWSSMAAMTVGFVWLSSYLTTMEGCISASNPWASENKSGMGSDAV